MVEWVGEETERRERKRVYKVAGGTLTSDFGHRHRTLVEEGMFHGLW